MSPTKRSSSVLVPSSILCSTTAAEQHYSLQGGCLLRPGFGGNVFEGVEQETEAIEALSRAEMKVLLPSGVNNSAKWDTLSLESGATTNPTSCKSRGGFTPLGPVPTTPRFCNPQPGVLCALCGLFMCEKKRPSAHREAVQPAMPSSRPRRCLALAAWGCPRLHVLQFCTVTEAARWRCGGHA